MTINININMKLSCVLDYRVSGCEATHCSRANALHTRFDWWAVSVGGFIDG